MLLHTHLQRGPLWLSSICAPLLSPHVFLSDIFPRLRYLTVGQEPQSAQSDPDGGGCVGAHPPGHVRKSHQQAGQGPRLSQPRMPWMPSIITLLFPYKARDA